MVLLLSASCASRAADDVVTWVAPYFPPFFLDMRDGQDGALDTVHRLVVEQLPQYQHQFLKAGYARQLYDMAHGVQECSYALFWTPERAASLIFSDPVTPILPPGLIVRNRLAEKLRTLVDEQGEVALDRLLTETDLSVGYVLGRSYGRLVDERLRQAGNDRDGNADRLVAVRQSRILMGMLAKNRVDVMLAYSSEAAFFYPEANADLTYFPLADQPPYLFHYYGCPKGQWGEQMIEAVNGVLRQSLIRQSAVQLYRATLLDDSLQVYDRIIRGLGSWQFPRRDSH